VRPYYELPSWYPRWMALDYGFTHPMSVHWFAMDPDNGRIFVYREVVQAGLTDRKQAKLIKGVELPDEKIGVRYASPDMWGQKNVDDKITTSADEFKAEAVLLTKADNDRLNGKRKIHRALANLPDGDPGLIVLDNCPILIKTMPSLVRSKTNPEDVEKKDGDDPYDSLRYGFTRMPAGEVEPQSMPTPELALNPLEASIF